MSVRAGRVGKDSHGPQSAPLSQNTFLPCAARASSGWRGREVGEGYRERKRALGRLEGKEAHFWDTSNSRLAKVLIICKKNKRDGQSKTRGAA